MAENWESEPLFTNADKARAAAKLGKKIKEKGWSHEKAADTAGHELKHALADPHRGTLKLNQDQISEYAAYHPLGGRTPQEVIKMASAPGSDMGPEDKLQVVKATWNLLFGWIKRI